MYVFNNLFSAVGLAALTASSAGAATIDAILVGPSNAEVGEEVTFTVTWTPNWEAPGPRRNLTDDFARVDFFDGSAAASKGVTEEAIELPSFRRRAGLLNNPEYYTWLFDPRPVPETKENTFSHIFDEPGVWTVELSGLVTYWRGVLREPNCCAGLTGQEIAYYSLEKKVSVTDPNSAAVVPLPPASAALLSGLMALGLIARRKQRAGSIET